MQSSNKAYQAPKLQSYGTLRDLTLGLAVQLADGPSGDSSYNPPRS